MKSPATPARIAALLVGVTTLAVVTLHSSRPAPAAASGVSAAKPVRKLVCARPFKLETGYVSAWRAERPLVTCGWLLVLDVDPSVVEPRDELEPVLYVGDQTAERVNHGDLAARCIVVVPSAPDAQGWPASDLTTQPMWFGAPALPEEVDAVALQAAQAEAVASGVAPFSPAEVGAARALGGQGERFQDRAELQLRAAQWILEFAPQERDFAQGMLAPPVR